MCRLSLHAPVAFRDTIQLQQVRHHRALLVLLDITNHTAAFHIAVHVLKTIIAFQHQHLTSPVHMGSILLAV
jgi:hypothetical protein